MIRIVDSQCKYKQNIALLNTLIKDLLELIEVPFFSYYVSMSVFNDSLAAGRFLECNFVELGSILKLQQIIDIVFFEG